MEEKEFPFYPLELPDLPPVEVEQPNQVEQLSQESNQVPNQPLDTPAEEPNQPLDAPTEEPNPQNQSNQQNQLPNVPDPMANQQLNWSYYKPEFAGKADEDAEAHFLRTNDWMDMHTFKVQSKGIQLNFDTS